MQPRSRVILTVVVIVILLETEPEPNAKCYSQDDNCSDDYDGDNEFVWFRRATSCAAAAARRRTFVFSQECWGACILSGVSCRHVRLAEMMF